MKTQLILSIFFENSILFTVCDWIHKSDALVQCHIDEDGALVVICVNELHFEITFKDLQEQFPHAKLRYSEPFIKFQETVSNSSRVSNFLCSLFFLKNNFRLI